MALCTILTIQDEDNLKMHDGLLLLFVVRDNDNGVCIVAAGFKAAPTSQAVIAPRIRLHVQSSETATHFDVIGHEFSHRGLRTNR
jgi:hypothetical protein